MTTLFKKYTHPNTPVVLFVLTAYHALYILLAYTLRIQRGHSDAQGYWGLLKHFDQSWLDYLKPGTHFIYFLNYWPVHWGWPFWSGFLLYGLIGLIGLLIFYRWAHQVIPDTWFWKPHAMMAVFLWPNLHVWTAALGKEPLVFLALAILFSRLSGVLKSNWLTSVAAVLLIMIRPHVALFLLLAGVPMYLLFAKTSLKTKLFTTTAILLLGSGLLYAVLQLTKIKRLDWERIQRFNNFSLKSFSDSGSYVPMDTYNILERLFAFFFRPLPFEAKNLLQLAAAAENTLYLVLHLVLIVLLIKNRNTICFKKIPSWVYFTGLFMLICGAFYIFRYANFGIFMRTKIIYAPFWIIAMLFLMSINQRIQKIE
ncbi:MAG: hypothetical protein ACK4FS_04895 [Flavobacterium sp.]